MLNKKTGKTTRKRLFLGGKVGESYWQSVLRSSLRDSGPLPSERPVPACLASLEQNLRRLNSLVNF